MSRTIAVLGAGPGLGLAMAHRFGRAGYRVALVSRSAARLDGFVAELTGAGIDAHAYPVDLTDPSALAALADAIERDSGPVDVLYLNGQPVADRIATPLDVDNDNLRAQLNVLLHTPVSLIGRFLPGMLDRGDGGVLVSLGASATRPMPVLANVGIAMAGLRNYVHTLNAALTDRGVYAGLLVVGALVQGSDTERMLAADPARADGADITDGALDPAELADTLYRQYSERDAVETRAGALA